MSRMHSGKRGTSASKRPYRTSPPAWIEQSPEDIENLVVQLAKKGETSSTIGVALRDQHGIPSAKLSTKQRIAKILEKHGIKSEIPEDLVDIMRKAVKLAKHREAYPRDMSALRGMQLAESKIKRLAKYYIREGRLPDGWTYDLEKAKLLVK